jgi:hypothetical protein
VALRLGIIRVIELWFSTKGIQDSEHAPERKSGMCDTATLTPEFKREKL